MWKLSAILLVVTVTLSAQSPRYGVGRPPMPEEMRELGSAIAPDGTGLPEGAGTVAAGRELFAAQCARCHGPTGEGDVGARLVGGQGTLRTPRPLKTVGSFWPYATTLWDYVNRAMPFDRPGLLEPPEVYAAVAYVLNLNGIIGADRVMDATSLPKVTMPNRDGFVADPRPDVGRETVQGQATARAASKAVISGPVGPSPYNIVRGWHKPFAEDGYAFGGNSGVFAESPNRIFVAQRGEARLPDPIPAAYAGFAGSIGINVLSAVDRRVWRNCLYTLDGDGRVKERWTQWDKLCEGSPGPGPHRLRISPYDPERRVWVVNETFNTIYVFSNDGSRLLKTLGEKNVPGDDRTHFGKPQDVAFLADGRVLVADGLDNHRIVILDRDYNYISEFGGKGSGPGQFNGVHALAVGPDGRIFALDRSGGRINIFRTTPDPAKMAFVGEWGGFQLPLDLIVNADSVWVTDLGPLRFTKLDMSGKHLYTWMVPPDLPDGYLEAHTITVDSAGNLYGGDNQYGRTQKFVPKPDADKSLLIGLPWSGR